MRVSPEDIELFNDAVRNLDSVLCKIQDKYGDEVMLLSCEDAIILADCRSNNKKELSCIYTKGYRDIDEVEIKMIETIRVHRTITDIKKLIEQLGYTVRTEKNTIFFYKSKLIFMIYIDTWEDISEDNIIIAVLSTFNYSYLTETPLNILNDLTVEKLEKELNNIAVHIQEEVKNKKELDVEEIEEFKKQNKVYSINYYYDNEEETIDKYILMHL